MDYILLNKQHFSPIKTNNKSSNFFSLKIILVIGTVIIFTGCSSLGGGSVQKRAAKLSNGIQKAYSVSPAIANRVSPMIVQSAQRYDVDPLLLAAMIQQESSYRSHVISSAGAVGLTQVMPRYWQKNCPGDLFQENININCGTFILATYNQASGSWKKALAYYNVGPTGYNTNRKMKRQGKKYANQVKSRKNDLKGVL